MGKNNILNIDFANSDWHPNCAARHLDVWCIRSGWVESQVQAIKMNALTPAQPKNLRKDEYTITPDGVAVIPLMGALMKGWSKFGGTSTLWARSAIRDAETNKDVKSIMVYIDSPGGTSAGTAELGDEISKTTKPIGAHIDDLGASAAYWAASQADFITANKAALVGSIGTYATIYDESKKAEMEGVKVHVISTGPHKGIGEPGTEITEEALSEWQKIVDDHFSLFANAVRSGRKMTASQVKSVSDGRVWNAKEALNKGLIDGIARFEESLIRLKRAR